MICGLTLSTYSQNIFNKKTKKDECVQGDCNNGFGTFIYSNGDKYIGEWSNSLKNGEGEYIWNDKRKYKGTFISDEFDNGVYYLSNGNYFSGRWYGGMPLTGDCNCYNSITSFNQNSLPPPPPSYLDHNLYLECRNQLTVKFIYNSDRSISVNNEPEIYMVVEEMPQFPCIDIKYNRYDENGEIIGHRTKEYCGDEGLMRYIQKNVRYPQIAKEYGITGKVFVGFVIDKDGSVTNVEIVSGADKNLDAEALRVIKSFPKFKPGFQRGQPVRVQFTIPINFTLN